MKRNHRSVVMEGTSSFTCPQGVPGSMPSALMWPHSVVLVGISTRGEVRGASRLQARAERDEEGVVAPALTGCL